MDTPIPAPQVPGATVQTPQAASVLGSPRCAVCGKPLGARAAAQKNPQVTCSGTCRGKRWRRRHEAALDAGLARLRDGLLLLRAQEVDRVLAELRSGPRDG